MRRQFTLFTTLLTVAVIFTLQLLSCQDREFEEVQSSSFLSKTGADQVELVTLPNGVVLQKIGDDYIMDGDIILSPEQVTALGGDYTTYGHTQEFLITRWPDGIIPYAFDSNVSGHIRATVRDAVAEIESKTRIRFIEKNETHKHYVLISEIPGNTSYSHVGYLATIQGIWLATGSSKYIAVHELGHTIGLKHEHVRHDRDEYVTVFWNAIAPGESYLFSIIPVESYSILYGPFDFNSVMLYGSYIFSNGAPTMTRKDNGQTFTGGRELSPGDADAINQMYTPPNYTISGTKYGCIDEDINFNISYQVDKQAEPVPIAEYIWEGQPGDGLEVVKQTSYDNVSIKYSTPGSKILSLYIKDANGTGKRLLSRSRMNIWGILINGSNTISYYNNPAPYTVLTVDSNPSGNKYSWKIKNPAVKYEFLDNWGSSIKIWYSGEKEYEVLYDPTNNVGSWTEPGIPLGLTAKITITESFFQKRAKIISSSPKSIFYYPAERPSRYDDSDGHIVPFVNYVGSPIIDYRWEVELIKYNYDGTSTTSIIPLDKADRSGILGTIYTSANRYPIAVDGFIGGYKHTLQLHVEETWPDNRVETYTLRKEFK